MKNITAGTVAWYAALALGTVLIIIPEGPGQLLGLAIVATLIGVDYARG